MRKGPNISAQARWCTSAVGVITPSRSKRTASTALQSSSRSGVTYRAYDCNTPYVGQSTAQRPAVKTAGPHCLDGRMPERAGRPPSRELIARAPKVLLHDHLDGGLRPGTVLELAARVGHDLPVDDAEGLRSWFEEAAASGSLERYLETFEHTVAVMQSAESLRRVARECVLDLAADGVIYAEIRYAPEQHLRFGLSLEQVVEAVRDGFADGEEQALRDGRPIVVRQLLTAMRHQARSREIAELTVA